MHPLQRYTLRQLSTKLACGEEFGAQAIIHKLPLAVQQPL
jgi:hypothetical protein